MRRAVLFGAWWCVGIAVAHLVQALVAIVPAELQTAMSLGWVAMTAGPAFAISSILHRERRQ